MDKCQECEGSLVLSDGIWICSACGLVDGEEVVGNISLFANYKKQGNTYFSSNYKRDKKKKGYSIGFRKKRDLDEVRNLEYLLKDTIPNWEDIKNQVFCFLDYNYKNNFLKTNNHKVLTWAITISLLRSKYLLEKESYYEKALNILRENNTNIFQSAERLIDRLLPKVKKEVNNLLNSSSNKIQYSTYVIDFNQDPSWRGIFRENFYLLFSKNQKSLLPNHVRLWEDEVQSAAIEVAKIFFKTLCERGEEGVKKQGLLCACSYMTCKLNRLKPLPQNEWAKFFGISERCLKQRIFEIKSMKVGSYSEEPKRITSIKEGNPSLT